MPYDESTAERVRAVLERRKGFVEKKVFGGVGFLLNGNMCVGVWKEFVIVRVGPADYEAALHGPYFAGIRHHGPADAGLGDGRAGGLRRGRGTSRLDRLGGTVREGIPPK